MDWLHKQKEQTVFLYLPFNAQHEPLQAPQKYMDRFPHIQDEWRRYFAASMSAMDDAVGRVLAQVRAMGEEDNTLVFFLSDNGGPTARTTASNGPLRGFKMTSSEGGTRVPFCVQWKGKIPAARVYEFPIQNLDILPTVMVAAGEKIDPTWKLDGVDLMPYISGKNASRPLRLCTGASASSGPSARATGSWSRHEVTRTSPGSSTSPSTSANQTTCRQSTRRSCRS